MKILMLAARNLFRNTRRTLITLMAITFGLAMIHFTINLQTGQYHEMITKGISTLAGHVVVSAAGYRDDPDPDRVLTGADAVAEALATALPDAIIAPRIFLGGLLNSPTSSVGVALTGLDPEAEAKVQDIVDKIREGRWLDDDVHGIVIGEKMAESLSVGLGDKLVYMGQHGDATEMTSQLFRVRGIFRTGSAELDGFAAFSNLEAARSLFGAGDIAHMVTVHLPEASGTAAALELARTALADTPGIEILSWRQALPEITAMIQLDRASGDVVLIILGIIVSMGVLNTVLMSALERTREFGVMMAIGMKPLQLARVILLEGMVLGILGSLLGIGAGLLLTWPAIAWGIDYSEYLGGESVDSGGVVVSTIFFARINPLRMGIYTLGAVVFTTLAALYPAIHVARLRPVDAMKHV
ncbi:MAG TPA: ABC transporter permease [Deltaproteobacteria bacterium]|nr:ABC transporter permease [Deltaproteobacteria bacterium]